MYTDEPFSAYRRHPWHGLEAIPDGVEPGIVRAYIEMLPSDTVKYELDKNTGFLVVDRPQRTTATPPALYGFIPRTYCAEEVAARCAHADIADGDPLDICIFSERLITRADILLNARVVGGIQMIDEGEADDKIIAVLEGDNIWGDVNDIKDLPPIKTERLQHYFSTYKMIPGKNVEIRVDGVYGRDEALKVIAASQKDYQNHYGHLLQKASEAGV
ncbi:inorganic pyrophosphatase [Draconibacterium sp.]|jgi:inorganic pyrophosphatase|nr:inorganic pyrophosphatase [Halieaceae bacterium]MDA7584379.1 inorganic pyrophosphatase [Luminiphilus sp.]MDB4583719.1 inorganic pyrophosphatase [Draconibacterium sp.]MDA8659383.1 inorganic pyrophosphatase [Luminiphilus sp.]MDA8826437.1 inorganic pyrophosphatase [Luminiphilus sp.]